MQDSLCKSSLALIRLSSLSINSRRLHLLIFFPRKGQNRTDLKHPHGAEKQSAVSGTTRPSVCSAVDDHSCGTNKVSLLSRRLWTAVNRGLILLRILDQRGYLTLPGTFNLLRPWANLHLDLLTFTATAEPKVSVQLLQQPLAKRVSHRVQSFCPQQSESVSSAQTLGAEISPRSRLVDKHAVNNPSAHISTFFYTVCLVST